MEVRPPKQLNVKRTKLQVESMRARDAKFMRSVFKREPRAKEIEAEPLADYARRKGITMTEAGIWKLRKPRAKAVEPD